MKVVINRCFGGFSPSDVAFKRMIELGMTVTKWDSVNKVFVNPDADLVFWDRPKNELGGFLPNYSFIKDRSDPELRKDIRLVQTIEELGKRASREVSDLRIVEIPDGVDFEIDEYDGLESIHEKHRSWS